MATDPEKPSPQDEPTLGDVTGDYVPRPDDPTEVGESDDKTRDAHGGVPTGDETSAFIVNQPAQDSQTIDQPGRTDVRAIDETGAASAGAFPRHAPQSQTSRYVLKKFHAKGGMGEVWLAEDSNIGREVALKRMRGGREEHKERFLLEAQVTGQLEHPGVIPVHEVGTDEDGQPYYVMKFVRGQTLTKAIEEYHETGMPGSVPKEVQRLRLLNIFINLCQTVAYAHSRGVIHRDIKPDNVMVGAYGETLVLDWGLAKVVGRPESIDLGPPVRLSASGESPETLAGSIKGTPSYLAPEVAFGKIEEVDQVSDVYLLGGTLYHMLTGRKPRHGTKLAEILEAARTKPPVPPRDLDPTIDRALSAICMKAMAFKKENRYADAGELAEDLQRYLAGEPVVAYRENFLERAARWVRKHRKAIGRTAVGAVVAGILVGAFLIVRDVQAQNAKTQEINARLQREDRARQDRDRFRELAEEMRYLAANADPAGGGGSFFDIEKAEAKGRAALAIADAWGPKLELLPLGDEERATLKEETYDLLLWMAQIGSRHSAPDKAEQTLKLLDQASALQTPTRSVYRLRAQARAAKGENNEDIQSAGRTTALDHFLDGEILRWEGLRTKIEPGRKEDSKKWKLVVAAQEKYRDVLRSDPNHFWSNYQLGSALLSLDQASEAAEAFGACVALRPKSPWGWSIRASALTQAKRFAEADRDLKEARKLDPNSPIIGYRAAQLLALQDKTGEAIDELKSILKSEAEVPGEVSFYRATLLFERGDYEEAMPDLERAVADKRPLRAAFLYRARGLLRENKIEAGLESLDRFIAEGQTLDLKDPATYEKRAKELRMQAKEGWVKDKKALLLLALAQTEKAAALGGKSASLFDEMGSILDRLGRFPQAIAAFSKAIEADPKEVQILMRRGWGWDKINPSNFKKGRADFELAVKLDPDNGEARAGLGYYQAWTDSHEKALRNANLATLYGGGDYGVLHNVACIFATLSHTDKGRALEYENMAIDQLRRGVELWKKAGSDATLNAIHMIRNEGAFPPSLKSRPEFRKLLADGAN